MVIWPIIYWGLPIIGIITLVTGIKINKEWERGVIFRLGKYNRTQKAGLFYRIPIIETLQRLDTRTQVMDVKSQSIITKDSVTVEVDAVVYYKIKQKVPENAVLNVEDWEEASTTLAQTTLRDKVGQHDLDDLLTKKEKIGNEIRVVLDKATDPWAIDVEAVEIRDVIIPESMERAMAKEAEAVREKRARITKADGEFQASKKLREAGETLTKGKNALTLRQLQTWQEIGAEQNSLIIVVPTDIVTSKRDITGLIALGKDQLKRIPKKSKSGE